MDQRQDMAPFMETTTRVIPPPDDHVGLIGRDRPDVRPDVRVARSGIVDQDADVSRISLDVDEIDVRVFHPLVSRVDELLAVFRRAPSEGIGERSSWRPTLV